MTHFRIIGCSILLIISGCKSRDKEPAEVEVSTPVIIAESEDFLNKALFLKPQTEDWLKFYFPQMEGLMKGDFERTMTWKEDSLLTFRGFPDPDFLTLYRGILIWSPNKKKILDPYSYQLRLKKNKSGIIESLGQDVDNQVMLFDTEIGRHYRLFFSGPSSWIEDGFFSDNTTAVLFGIKESPTQSKYAPFVWLIDLSNMTFREFIFNKDVPKEKIGKYLPAKFPEIKFR